MQRHSAAIRPLFHYKGHPDPLKGDALNKAVRDTAHETIAAIFAGENDKPSPAEDLNKRIQGLGNTNYEMPSEETKSFLSESPTTLRRSLTIESEHGDRYEPVDYRNETQGSFGISKNVSSGSWSQDSRVFLVEAAKLDALALSYALESKLQSPQWQVRMRAICVPDSLLRKKDDEHFSTVESYFSENKDVVVRCSESPQASLKEKAYKVLYLLSGEQAGSAATYSEKTKKADTTTVVPMPDLIDTDGPGTGVSASESKNDDDPFADVSFHASDSVEHADDLFSGMTVDDKQSANENHMTEKKNGPELFDIFGSNHELPQEQETHKKDLNDLMDGLSINENTSNMKKKGTSPVGFPQSLFSDSNSHPSHQVPNDALSGMFNSQTAMTNANVMFPPGAMPYNISPGLMMNPTFSSQPLNYADMGSLLAQRQLLATMSNLQHLGNMNTQNAGVSHVGGTNGAYVPPLPDIFQSNFPTQQATSTMMNSSKKEETRAFDFTRTILMQLVTQRGWFESLSLCFFRDCFRTLIMALQRVD
uniref:Uncharacterized protein n=1 Tax=Quercus lobata TaxID=97700 RepID=A0A7N2LH02_QUELO